MTDQERNGFVKLMRLIGNTYNRATAVDSVDLYFNILRDYSLLEVTRVIEDHMSDPDVGQYFPKPADITRRMTGTTQSRGLMAFDAARREIRRTGSYLTPHFEDPIIRATIDALGGWPAFCAMEADQVPFEQKRFVERYQSYLRRPPERIPAKVVGRHEIDNGSSQYAADPRALGSGQPTQAPPSLCAGPKPEPRPTLPAPKIRSLDDLKRSLVRGTKALGDGGPRSETVENVEAKRAEAKARLAALETADATGGRGR